MKTIVLLAIALAAGTLAAHAQDIDPTINTNVFWRAEHPLFVFQSEGANEIRRGRYIYSGLAVDIIKEKNPLRVLDPYAPGNNTGKDNVARKPSGEPAGWNLLTIRF